MIGSNIHAHTAEQLYDGTNAVFLALLTGTSDQGPPEIGVAVHVDDVALLHVLALDQNKVPKNANIENFFIASGKPYTLSGE